MIKIDHLRKLNPAKFSRYTHLVKISLQKNAPANNYHHTVHCMLVCSYSLMGDLVHTDAPPCPTPALGVLYFSQFPQGCARLHPNLWEQQQQMDDGAGSILHRFPELFQDTLCKPRNKEEAHFIFTSSTVCHLAQKMCKLTTIFVINPYTLWIDFLF